MLTVANETLSGWRTRFRGSAVRRFLVWWGKELAAILPERLARRMVPPRPVLMVVADADGSGLTVWRETPVPERIGRFAASEDVRDLRERWMKAVHSFPEGNPQVLLGLPTEAVLARPIELPLAVESNLHSAIAYQLDQWTPFQAADVYFDYRVIERDAESGQLLVDLRIVPKTHLEPILDRLAAIGITPHCIDSLDLEAPAGLRREDFNLLPESERPRYVYARARLNWRLAGLAVLVLAGVMAQSLYLRQLSIDKLDQEAAELRAQAEQVLAMQRQLEDSLQAANFLADRRRRQPVVIQILDDVTRRLPDDIWINQLQIRGNELMLLGLADESQRLIEMLNQSELLDETEFRGSINVDPNTGQERFNVRATIVQAEIGDARIAGTE